MKRYDPIQQLDQGGVGVGEMQECADGEWVKWDDVKAAIASNGAKGGKKSRRKLTSKEARRIAMFRWPKGKKL